MRNINEDISRLVDNSLEITKFLELIDHRIDFELSQIGKKLDKLIQVIEKNNK